MDAPDRATVPRLSIPLPTRLRRALRSVVLGWLLGALSHLPLRAGLRLATAAGRIGWVVARGTRRRMLANLALALPELSAPERERIGRDCLVHLAWLAVEMLTLRDDVDRLEDYVTFAPGAEARLREAMASGRGLVMVSGHLGHWELLARRVARAGIPSATVARAGSDPRVAALIDRFRGEGNFEVLLRDAPGTARAIIRCFRQGKLLGLLIDQDTSVQGVFVPFFGRPAWTPRAAGDLALRFRAPVAVIWSRRRGPAPGAGHELQVEHVPYDAAPADAAAESLRITAACTAILERAIRERPSEWVWMHDRWRRRPPA